MGCGGVLRDSKDDFVFAFSHRLEAFFVLEAKLWDLYHGLSIAWGNGYKNLIIEVGSTVVIDLLLAGSNFNHPFHQLIKGILEIWKDEIVIT